MFDSESRKRSRPEEPEGNSDARTRTPRSFYCPLTMEVMYDPVLDHEGNTYERSALVQWLSHNRTSPISRQPLNERMILRNNALRETIHEVMGSDWVLEQGNRIELERSSPCVELWRHSSFRSKIDCFLQNTCQELDVLGLKLNSDGCCAFRYDTVTIVLDVPEKVGVFCLYTKDLVTIDDQNVDRLCKRALELNFLQGDTRGGCLSVRSRSGKREEVMFSYTDRVPEICGRDFSNILLNFVETSVVLRRKLMQSTALMPSQDCTSEEVVLKEHSSQV